LRVVGHGVDDKAIRKRRPRPMKFGPGSNVALPLDPSPGVVIWSKQVVGPITDNPIEGMFWNIEPWGIKQ
jgi:hypothetical protein